MGYTPEQLQNKTNAELDEICATAQGFYKSDLGRISDYAPTTNRYSMVDLVAKYDLTVCANTDTDNSKNLKHSVEIDKIFVLDVDLLRAVTIASILVAQGEEQ